jgi:hypothetical protein
MSDFDCEVVGQVAQPLVPDASFRGRRETLRQFSGDRVSLALRLHNVDSDGKGPPTLAAVDLAVVLCTPATDSFHDAIYVQVG